MLKAIGDIIKAFIFVVIAIVAVIIVVGLLLIIFYGLTCLIRSITGIHLGVYQLDDLKNMFMK